MSELQSETEAAKIQSLAMGKLEESDLLDTNLHQGVLQSRRENQR